MKKLLLPILFFSFILGSCGESDTPKEDTNMLSTIDSGAMVDGKEKTQKVFYAIPSPVEIANIIKKTGASFNLSFLNPLSNAGKYSTASSKALNLGIYGCDLSYTSIFDQTQESMNYMKCTKKLADGLGIAGAFTPETLDRLEKNIANKDSLLQIVSDTYWATDSYLKENERSSTSALVIAGGWIEGLYLATRIANANAKNEEVLSLIGDQRLTLDNLLGLLSSYPNETSIANITKELLELKTIFADLTPINEKSLAKDSQGSTTIGGGTTFEVSKQQLAKISTKIESIRNGITK